MKRGPRWQPKLIGTLRETTWKSLASDLLAGVTVGLVALPLAMAFAISSGVPPQAGLYCAIVAGFLISALGGSRTQIGGPTGAFVVIVFGIVAQHGMNGLLVCTLMAGVILVLLGITGLGSAIQYIPRPVVVGFTNGIAVLIASTQIKDFFGLQIESLPGDFFGRMQTLAAHASTISLTATVVALTALLVIVLLRRFFPRLPGTIVALVLGTLLVVIAAPPLETIGTRYGGIPGGMPAITIPDFDPSLLTTLLSPALTIALLGAIESLMSAVVADRLSGDAHNPNVELVAQGVANLAVPWVGGIPATGAIARTATNIRSGAKSPLAGMIHALTLLAVLLFAAPLASHIPLAVLAAILMVVAYHMGEWREIPRLLKMSWATIAVWFTTFTLTVFADLTIAVQVGIVLAALLFIRKVGKTTTVSRVTADYIEAGREHSLQLHPIPDGVTILRIHGPFLFGTTQHLRSAFQSVDELTPIVILRLRNMTALDATGLSALEEFVDELRKQGRTVLMCGARQQPAQMIKQSGLDNHIGRENVCPNIQSALARARHLLEKAASQTSGS